MELIEAAVVAAWIVIAVLALALAGLLRQVRDLQGALAAGASAQPVRRVPEALHPAAGTAARLVLVVDDHCPLCGEVLPAVVDAAARLNAGAPDLTVVAPARAPGWPDLAPAEVLIDPELVRRLSVPFTPALLTVGSQGVVNALQPVGSAAAAARLVREAAEAAQERTLATVEGKR